MSNNNADTKYQAKCQLPNNDEVDLVELFKALWKGRLAILVSTVLCTVITALYAFNAQERWTSSVKYIEPGATDNQAVKDELLKYKPLMGDALGKYITSAQMLKSFNQLARQSDVKKNFIKQDPTFLNYLKSENINLDTLKGKKELKEWADRITFTSPNPKKADETEFQLKLTAMSSGESYKMLQRYIDYVNILLKNQLEQKIVNDLRSRTNQLQQSIELKTHRALTDLAIKLEQYKVALAIANGANIEKPIENFNIGSQFRADLGSKAIFSALKELGQVKDVTVLDPSIERERYNHTLLKSNEFTLPSETQFISFTSSLEEPLTRDQPKRALIIVLGLLLGGMMGTVYVLIRNAFFTRT
ncbi:Wzz/FepE/Etk N-terminal domain-containing protein [Vibrio rotiferianus]|uniref:Wzz/FepE/Etk N-terminal domain-containing protein n=1 Tax=Vibrio rotiferianus TaxID=190895 RepID=UPI0014862E96|nr:Wzz/FepE/Etk N-terminal domain-containing protein [Vibrio rotiferianus]